MRLYSPTLDMPCKQNDLIYGTVNSTTMRQNIRLAGLKNLCIDKLQYGVCVDIENYSKL